MLHWTGSDRHRPLTLLDWAKTLEDVGTDAQEKVGLFTQEIKLEKGHDLPFLVTMRHLKPGLRSYSLWNCRCQWSAAGARGAWKSTVLVVERIVERLRLSH